MLGLHQGLIKGQRGLVAWVNFNGTGTVAIRSSYNVSSITDNSVGNYTVNFSVPMMNADYCVVITLGLSGNIVSARALSPTTTDCLVIANKTDTLAAIDVLHCNVVIFH